MRKSRLGTRICPRLPSYFHATQPVPAVIFQTLDSQLYVGLPGVRVEESQANLAGPRRQVARRLDLNLDPVNSGQPAGYIDTGVEYFAGAAL